MQQKVRNDDAMRAISKAVWINEGGSWGIRAGRVSAALQGFQSTHVSARFRRAREPHDTCCLSPCCSSLADAVTEYDDMDRVPTVPKPNEMCSATQPQLHLSSLKGFQGLREMDATGCSP